MSADTGKSKHIRINVLQKQLRWILAALVVGLFLVLLYPNLIIEHHHYDIGDIAENDIKATQDFFIEDQAATAASRDQAVEQVLTVYDFDPRLTQQIVEKTLSAFKRMSDLAAKLQAHLPHGAPQPDDPPSSQVAVNEIESALLARKAEFEALLGIEVSRGAFKLLSNEQFSPAIAETIKKIVITIMTNGVVANKEVLLKEAEKGITLRNVENHTERTTYALRQYYGPDQAKTMVRIVAEPIVESLNYNIINLIVDFSQQLLQPNITFNRAETESRKQQALSDIKPVMYQIKAGEMLLREGERVSKVQLLKLDELRRQETHQDISTINLGTAVMLFILMVVMYTLFFFNPRFHHLNTNKNLFFLCLVLFLVWVITKISMTLSAAQIPNASFVIPPDAFIFAAPVATGAMLICLVLGFDLALPFGLLAATCAALLTGGRLEVMLYFLVGSIMSAFWTQHCRERKVIILAGTKVAVLNAVLASAIGFYTAEPHGTALVWSSALAFLGGILSGIITLGIAPLVEMTFSYSTDITLLELANLDRPILRRLMIEAPGTYHHSVVVGSLVEAAASQIGANPLLAKVCGYYHDIGKVKKPLYFIENQRDGRNKHDKLAPSMSSLILIAHVKDGVDIARKHKLGQIIIDTIQQHHGSSLIHYFFEKAKQLKGENAVKIDDFRYPGPKPQTKEVGLVMLADVVEAASRTLENPTPARIQGLVQHLINKIFSDGQLDNCELTLKDLHSIARSFNKILNGIHHHRIEYTEAKTKEGDKTKNGSSDRQSTAKTSHRDPNRTKESPSHLKRLGLS